MRKVSWFSCGAASALASKLSAPDVIAYCDTGAEHEDNQRFMRDCEQWFDKSVLILKSEKFKDTWDVWERRKYIAGVAGAPCTSELKIKPRLQFQHDDDLHIFGYTADAADVKRFAAMQEHWPDLDVAAPLIERGITKAGCLSMIEKAGIKPPLTYALGFPNANCLPCCKATSPAYWALVRKHFPQQFNRMAKLSRQLGARLARVNDERVFIDEVAADQSVTQPLAPDCDFLCQIAEQEYGQ